MVRPSRQEPVYIEMDHPQSSEPSVVAQRTLASEAELWALAAMGGLLPAPRPTSPLMLVWLWCALLLVWESLTLVFPWCLCWGWCFYYGEGICPKVGR